MAQLQIAYKIQLNRVKKTQTRVNKLRRSLHLSHLAFLFPSCEHKVKHANTIRPGDKQQCSLRRLELWVNHIPITIAL